MSEAPWGDHLPPLSAEESQQQLAAIVGLLAGDARRVIDLGCGDGRMAVPLLSVGHEVIAIDTDPARLETCRRGAEAVGASERLDTRQLDFTEPWPADLSGCDMVCCLGNTMMTIADVNEGVTVLAAAAAALRAGGVFVMDDCPGVFFPEVTGGNWQEGVTDDGRGQLVWAPDDPVFALRWGDAVDENCWTLRDDDQVFRLWTAGTITLAARLAGLSEPARVSGGALLILRLPDPASSAQ